MGEGVWLWSAGLARSMVSVTRLVAEVASHGEVTRGGDTRRSRVSLCRDHTQPGGTARAAAALTETALATDPPLAGGDHRSHLLKLHQRNPAWIKLSGFLFFFPSSLPFCVFFLERERETERDTAYYDCASKNKYILIL